jgi:hypothetical protein
MKQRAIYPGDVVRVKVQYPPSSPCDPTPMPNRGTVVTVTRVGDGVIFIQREGEDIAFAVRPDDVEPV